MRPGRWKSAAPAPSDAVRYHPHVRRGVLLVCALAALTHAFTTGCTRRLGYPYSTQELARDARDRPRVALIHYLGQANADPEVCRRSSTGAGLARVDASVLAAVAEAIAAGTVKPGPAGSCLGIGLDGLPSPEARELLAALAEVYLEALQERVPRDNRGALHAVLRDSTLARDNPDVLEPLERALNAALEAQSLAPGAYLFAEELRDALGLAHGRWRGAPVTTALVEAQDDATLELFVKRLPRESQRDLARRELVVRRVARSDNPDVARDAQAVVQRLLDTGRNAIDLERHPLISARFAPRDVPLSVVVHQRPPLGTAALLAAEGQNGKLLPRLPLQGWLLLRASDHEREVTLCAARAALDPEPCVLATDLRAASGHMTIDGNGVLRLQDNLTIAEATKLLMAELPSLSIDIRRGTRPLASRALPLYFRAPDPLHLPGEGLGSNGPNLHVRAYERGQHVAFEVRTRGSRMLAVVDPRAPGRFSIATAGTRGAAGHAGATGHAGTSGISGMNASCYGSAGSGGPGGPGGAGGPGGNGGPGGDGGHVRVEVICEPHHCEKMSRWVRRRVHSIGGQGGPGGPGGRGGSGGAGGQGGMGSSCREQTRAASYSDGKYTPAQYRNTYKPGGSSGIRGSDGPRGRDGAKGPNGKSGTIELRIVPKPP